MDIRNLTVPSRHRLRQLILNFRNEPFVAALVRKKSFVSCAAFSDA
jgi:hypothetical protein